VSLLPEFYETADRPLRDAIVHQSYSGDLAIRQAAWKLVQMQNGQLELYNLETDLSETDNVLSANPETAARLKNLMQTCIDRGRSTPGAPQTNEFNFGAK
jgi:arylsulfatase A